MAILIVRDIVDLIEKRIESVMHIERAAYGSLQAKTARGEQQQEERLVYWGTLGQRLMLEGILAEIKGEKYVYKELTTT